jgi:hypothetical protein
MRELTKETLQFFSQVSWASPPEFARALGFWPVKCAYAWLRRLYKRYHWLRADLDARGRVIYQLTGQGARRLLYLKTHPRVYKFGHEDQTR